MLAQTLFYQKHLEKGEVILFGIHRHWILMLRPGLATGFFGFLVPWGFYAAGFSTPVFFWIAVGWSAVAYLIFLYELFEWYAGAILITSMGVLKVDWKGFFSNVASRVTYEDVEGAHYEIKGFWPTVLRHGKFSVLLASGNNFSQDCTARPGYAEHMLMKLREAYMMEKNKRDVVGLKSLLSDLALYHLKNKKD